LGRAPTALFNLMKQRITGFARDEHGDWTATLECGHRQHVRHNPPLMHRPWVLTPQGRRQKLSVLLDCLHCDNNDDLATTGGTAQ
jgi:hypothetical protein